ncbi:Ig-like domain-containing protein, partial [Butyrivibrio sp. AE3006]|uniref:Ig-like domain-containing protein n=1 Tax=Butyrivibrio sp. AE3006 TaxID=1280673 RepID=UPI001FA727AD
MKIKMKKMLGIILSFALVLGLIPGMSLTAYAAPEETLLTTITPTGEITYSETTAGVVTVSHNNDYYNEYYGWLWSSTVDTLTVSGYEGYTITKVIFKQYQRGTVTDSSAPFELHFVNGSYGHVICQENDNMNGVTSIEVYGYTVAVTGVSLNKNTATLTVGGTETLTATVSPDDASDKSVTWSSDNTGVATVSDGVVTAVAEGTANITVTATNGTDDTSDDKTATCAVTVTENNGDTKQNPDGTKTVTKENADGKTISVTNYSKTDEQISQFVFEKA